MKLLNYIRLLTSLVILSVALPAQSAPQTNLHLSASPKKETLTVHQLADGLRHPWGMAWLDAHHLLITEKRGQLLLLTFDNPHYRAPKINRLALPIEVFHVGQGGLLDIAIDPDFVKNAWIYISFAKKDGTRPGHGSTALARFQIDLTKAKRNRPAINKFELLFTAEPSSSTGYHFGSRIAFDADGHVFFTIGDRGNRDSAQNLKSHNGSVIRLYTNGQIPKDNPFYSQPNAKKEIYSYGHRNPQGLVFYRGKLYAHEHGPQGGDELNRVKKGANYGWPKVTFGKEYGSGADIGSGTLGAGFEPPLYYWLPSIAPSGLMVYEGTHFGRWRGDFLIGSLKFQLISKLTPSDARIAKADRMLQNQIGRVRDLSTAPDGSIFVISDAYNGGLWRLHVAE